MMQRDKYEMRSKSCVCIWLVEEEKKHAKLGWVNRVNGGHGLKVA